MTDLKQGKISACKRRNYSGGTKVYEVDYVTGSVKAKGWGEIFSELFRGVARSKYEAYGKQLKLLKGYSL